MINNTKPVKRSPYISFGTDKGTVQVRCAITFIDRLVGLLSSRGLPIDNGMHFPKCSAVHTFGMRFAIDVLFLDAECRVVKIVTMPGWRIKMYSKADSVLELKAGASSYHAIKIGQMLWKV